MKVLRLWCLALTAIAAVASSASAQNAPTGGLTGRVVDTSQSAIPGVTVTATNTATNESRMDITNGQGVYRIVALPVGLYQVTFRIDGFKTTSRSGVIVDASVPRSLEVQLEVGALTETVTVSADAPLLTRTTVATARSLTFAELEAVPTTTGSFTHLLSSEAGVSADLPPVLVNGTGNISPSVNGTRTTSTSLFFNGIDATNLTTNEGAMNDNIAPATETLEEVKLQTSLYDASVGRFGRRQLPTRHP